jgi:hypothetical protein
MTELKIQNLEDSNLHSHETNIERELNITIYLPLLIRQHSNKSNIYWNWVKIYSNLNMYLYALLYFHVLCNGNHNACGLPSQ